MVLCILMTWRVVIGETCHVSIVECMRRTGLFSGFYNKLPRFSFSILAPVWKVPSGKYNCFTKLPLLVSRIFKKVSPFPIIVFNDK